MMRWRPPAGKLGVERLATGEHFNIIGNVIVPAIVGAIADAYPDGLDRVQTVEVRHCQLVDAIDHGGMARGDRIEPTAAARPSCCRAKLASHGVKHVGYFSVLRRPVPFTHSR